VAAVFTGTVTNIAGGGTGLARILDPIRRWLGLGITSSADPVSVTVQVQTAWKGVTTTPVLVQTAASGASCGYHFVTGRQYLIYAYGDGARLGTGLCTRTTVLSQAAADLAYLQTVPPLTVTPAPGAGLLPVLCLALAALLVLSALPISLALRRRAVRQP
jgi:hypothetical protein